MVTYLHMFAAMQHSKFQLVKFPVHMLLGSYTSLKNCATNCYSEEHREGSIMQVAGTTIKKHSGQLADFHLLSSCTIPYPKGTLHITIDQVDTVLGHQIDTHHHGNGIYTWYAL